ncbi:bifunctional lysylphosphatidylglycerol flippase/synthetase MprF [Sinimarinibacterium sp. CAU 1509]|uniref:bifunctional lysylphosphatidylglycerol flippase/synthetase MprF n=1 Tax=Sinimarinibacterium sp. CAU 1509 TaxID=2562283 RepID=UPI0010AD305D|nr:bifunctional lysylphosphatidylglycerol flippase/synthetase MprF [Sinimarinibacterium sp. CAU 1509]TJY59438.1 bifunctional lysylphosphatidylglycerol flippase/synthetase MprF [Sinimarinibacterium sp. CAU 1509]
MSNVASESPRTLGRWRQMLQFPLGGAPAAALTILLFSLALWMLHRELGDFHPSQFSAQLRAVTPQAIAWALLLTGASYFVLTLHDVIALRAIARKLPYSLVSRVAYLSYAIGHNVGFAALSGGAMRLRMYGSVGLTTLEITSIVAIGSATFFMGAALLLDLSLLLDAGDAARVLHITNVTASVGGWGLLALLLAYVAIAGRKRTLAIGSWSVNTPGATTTVLQFVLGALDIVFAASAFYVLLPADPNLSLPAFTGLYVVAMVAALASGVPGGIGVFESILLVLLPQQSPGAVLAACALYRAIYYLLPFAAALALMVVQEVALRGKTVRRLARGAGGWIGLVTPQVLGVAVFIAGTVLLISGALPSVGSRMGLIPLPLVELSHLAGSATGAGLLILARGLLQRIDAAYYLTQVLLATGIAASLLKGGDYEEASLLLAVMSALRLARPRFDRHATLRAIGVSGPWLAAIAITLLASIWIGLLAFRHVQYHDALWLHFALNADAPRMLRAALTAVAVAAGLLLWLWLSPARPRLSLPDARDLEDAAACVRRSTQTSANLVFTGDKRLLFCDERDAFIMFQVSGRSWIAMGDPVGNPQRFDLLAWRFRELCDRHAAWPVFYQVGAKLLPMYLDLGLSPAKLGEEARVALADFSLEGPRRADIRHSHRRAQRDGAQFELLQPTQVQEQLNALRLVSNRWLSNKSGAEKGFSIGAFTQDYVTRFPCGVVRVNGEIVAFATLWCTEERQELSVDLMRYDQRAPKGAMEFLFAELMLWGKTEGYAWFNLGVAPLAGLEAHPLASPWHKLGIFIYRQGETFYNFDGLRRYKAKYDPQWQPRYLVSPGGLRLPRVLLDTASLIGGGVRGVIRR